MCCCVFWKCCPSVQNKHRSIHLIELKTPVLRDFRKRSNEFAEGGRALATLIYLYLSNLNEEGVFLCLLQGLSISWKVGGSCRRRFTAEADVCSQHCSEEAALFMLLIQVPSVKCLQVGLHQ